MNRNQRLTRSAVILAVLATVCALLGLAAMIFGPLLSLQITGGFIILLAGLLASVTSTFMRRITVASEQAAPNQFEQLLEQTKQVVTASKRLKEDQQALIQCLQSSPTACWMKNTNNKLLFVNKAWIAATGVSEQKWMAQDASIPSEFLNLLQNIDDRVISTGVAQRAQWDHPTLGGMEFHSHPTLDSDGSLVGVAGWLDQKESVTHSAQANPLIDSTTQLGNYRFATEWLQQAIDTGDNALAVILVNIKAFATINHTVGHQQADSLLVEIGKRIATLCDDNTQAARIEKDHFALLLKHIEQPEYIMARVTQLNQALQASYALTNLGMQPEFVIGMAQFVVNAETAAELINAAQIDMRNQISVQPDASITPDDQQSTH